MQIAVVLLIILVVVLPFAWLATEFFNNRPLRIALGIVSIVSCAVCAYNVGNLGGEFNANSYFATANQTLINTTIDELDHSHMPQVLASLRQLQDQYHPNYENRSHYDELVSQAVTQMKMASAASRHAATASDGRVEMWRGGVGRAYPFPALSVAGASVTRPCSVSTSRSSNRTCGFAASGSPTGSYDRHTSARRFLRVPSRFTTPSSRST